MAWSKITHKGSKPLRWWMHKLFCEWGWIVRHKDNYATYYHHLNMCLKQGFTLYGEPVNKNKDLYSRGNGKVEPPKTHT